MTLTFEVRNQRLGRARFKAELFTDTPGAPHYISVILGGGKEPARIMLSSYTEIFTTTLSSPAAAFRHPHSTSLPCISQRGFLRKTNTYRIGLELIKPLCVADWAHTPFYERAGGRGESEFTRANFSERSFTSFPSGLAALKKKIKSTTD